MTDTTTEDFAAVGGRVLITDDERVSTAAHSAMLAPYFDIATAVSGTVALELCRTSEPDLVLMDIEMPGLDGVETCQRLREFSSVPVIFVTGHRSLDMHLKALEAGGDDLVVKPVNHSLLLHKVAAAIRRHRAHAQLAEEKQSLERMAMDFLSTMGGNGILLNFMRDSIACRTHADLAQRLHGCVSELGLRAIVRIRHGAEFSVVTEQGDPSPLELSVLDKVEAMGRIFQFKSRLAVNYPRVSIVARDMPEEAERAGPLRDNLVILAETAEALCENVDMRVESMARAEYMQLALGNGVAAVEALRRKYLAMLGDTRLLLHDLEQGINRQVSMLGATQVEEEEITRLIDGSVRRVLALLAEGGDFEQDFGRVLDALRGDSGSDDVELF
ncbi:MAG: response regulator [Rhodocyclaceae bacterium]|nr:response regulator [Rhodocyclaceae bacterium]